MRDSTSSKYQWLFITGGLLCLLFAFGLVTTFKGRFVSDPPSVQTSRSRELPQSANDEFADDKQTGKQDAKSSDDGKCMVYITGAVVRPGVYEIPHGGRVQDAVLAAGGFSGRADPEAVNLAARVTDEEHIKIPLKGEATAPRETNEALPNKTPKQSVRSTSAVKAVKADSITDKVNINRAGATELATLPGIGPKLSQTIIDYRDTNGPFQSLEDIKRVRGIGDKRFEALRDLITVGK